MKKRKCKFHFQFKLRIPVPDPNSIEDPSKKEKKKFTKMRNKKDIWGAEMWGTFEEYNPEEEKKFEKPPIIPFTQMKQPNNFAPFPQSPNPNPMFPRMNIQNQLKIGITGGISPSFNSPMFPMQPMNPLQPMQPMNPMMGRGMPFLSNLNTGFKPMHQFSPQMSPNPFPRSPMSTQGVALKSITSSPMNTMMQMNPSPSGGPSISIGPPPIALNPSNVGTPGSAGSSNSLGGAGGNTPTSDLDKKPKKRYSRKKKEEENKTTEEESKEVEAVVKPEEKKNQNLLKVTNVELEKGDWLKQIIWDDSFGPEIPMNTKLILDLNDQNMIFQQTDKNAIPTNNSIPKKSAGKFDAIEPITRIESNSFNLSNDREYESGGIYSFQKKGRHIVKHSLPALKLDPAYFRTFITPEELKNLHRPKYFFDVNKIIPIEFRPPKKEKPKRKLKGIQKATDLSAHDHRLVLIEYVEEKPPLLNNVGMATKICNYYKNTENDEELPPSVEDGIPILVDSEEAVPLIGKLEEGKFLRSTENTLYSSQIFKHEVSESDFLLSTRETPNGIKFYVREIPIIYSAGHTQPHIECPAPNSRQAIQFTKNRLNLFIYRQFSKTTNVDEMRIKIDDIRETFPTMSETSVRKRLKECADFQRGGDSSGFWTAKKDFLVPPEDQLFDLVTPEMVCMNESMESGQLRLDETGITNDVQMAAFAFSSAKLGSGFEKYKDVIHFIDEERKNTPWNKSANFINAIEGKEGSKLELLGIANQTLKKEEIEHFSKIAEDIGKAESEKTHQIQLSHEEAKQILIEKGGYTEDRILKMTSRTERKQTARKILESLGQGGRKNVAKEKAKNSKLREILLNIFIREAKKLENGIPYYEDGNDFGTELDGTDDSDLDSDFEKDLENELEKEFKSDGENDDEEQELKELLDEKINHKSDSDSDHSDAGSVKSVEQVPIEKKKKYFVRKITTIHNPDGTSEDKVEIIREPHLVDYYVKRREKKTPTTSTTSTSTPSTAKKEQTTTDTTHSAKDRRKLQDQFRRWMKEKERKEERISSGMAPPGQVREKKIRAPGEKPPRRSRPHQAKIKTNLKCGACGQIGHMLTNRSCPMYVERNNSDKSENSKVTITEEGASMDGTKSGLKISIPTSILKGKKEKKKVPEFLSHPQIKRRRKTTTDQIADIFHTIIDVLKQEPAAIPFLNPVDKIQFPEYRKIVAKPIDLSTIHKKIANLEYLDGESFMKDIELMKNNAYLFCQDKFKEIPPQADIILKLAASELKKYEAELEDIKNAPTTTPTFTRPTKKKKGSQIDEDLIGALEEFEDSKMEENSSEVIEL
jgi:transcription initiation factor TFIID subunit 1